MLHTSLCRGHMVILSWSLSQRPGHAVTVYCRHAVMVYCKIFEKVLYKQLYTDFEQRLLFSENINLLCKHCSITCNLCTTAQTQTTLLYLYSKILRKRSIQSITKFDYQIRFFTELEEFYMQGFNHILVKKSNNCN